MKNFRSVYFLLLLLVPMLFSCNDDNDNNTMKLSLLTVRTLDDAGYYFETDSVKKVNINSNKHVSYKPTDGQRAFVYYNLSDEKVSGYEYNMDVYSIQDVLTKPVIELTAETADSIADHNINVTRAWISKDHINIEYWVYHSGAKQHMLNLVDNTTSQNGKLDDYINLEFRHNHNGDSSTIYKSNGLVCFKLNGYNPAELGKKGINLRVNTSNAGVMFFKIDLEKKSKDL